MKLRALKQSIWYIVSKTPISCLDRGIQSITGDAEFRGLYVVMNVHKLYVVMNVHNEPTEVLHTNAVLLINV